MAIHGVMAVIISFHTNVFQPLVTLHNTKVGKFICTKIMDFDLIFFVLFHLVRFSDELMWFLVGCRHWHWIFSLLLPQIEGNLVYRMLCITVKMVCHWKKRSYGESSFIHFRFSIVRFVLERFVKSRNNPTMQKSHIHNRILWIGNEIFLCWDIKQCTIWKNVLLSLFSIFSFFFICFVLR